MIVRCKHIKPGDGGVVDGCGWMGTRPETGMCPECGSAMLRIIEPVRDPLLTPEVSQAFNLLLSLSNEQRARIFCWFCSGCHKHMGPAQGCTCVVVLTQAEVREERADAWDDGYKWGYDGDTDAKNPHRETPAQPCGCPVGFPCDCPSTVLPGR